MQDLTPDMEDLLRRASEAYPLKQSEDKWIEIASRLSERSVDSGEKQKAKRQFKKHYAILLVLLLFSFLFLNRERNQTNLSLEKIQKQNSKSTLISNNEEKKRGLQNDLSEIKKLITGQSTTLNHLVAGTKRSAINNYQNIISGFQSNIESGIANNFKPSDDRYSIEEKLSITKNDFKSPVFINLSIEKGNILTKNNITLVQATTAPQLNEKNKFIDHGFYFGILAGVHINSIKGQAFNKQGFDAGILAGYRLSNKISLESGLLLTKKVYWTTGRYFSIEEMKSAMPSGMKITEVHGSNRSIEIPLHLRYDLVTKKNHRFFTSAGISSYIMTKENNQYNTMYNGAEAKMYASYKKDRRYFAASFDLAFGYEKDSGKKNRIRFEPYLQIPLKGIGIGDLPVKSFGLRIALTRHLN